MNSRVWQTGCRGQAKGGLPQAGPPKIAEPSRRAHGKGVSGMNYKCFNLQRGDYMYDASHSCLVCLPKSPPPWMGIAYVLVPKVNNNDPQKYFHLFLLKPEGKGNIIIMNE